MIGSHIHIRRKAVVAASLCLLLVIIIDEQSVADVEVDPPDYGFEVVSSIENYPARGIWVHKNHLYVAHWDFSCPGEAYGVDVYDVSDPTKPVHVSHLPAPSGSLTRDVRVGTLETESFVGDIAVVPVSCPQTDNRFPKRGTSLVVWDVTDPAHPQLLSTWGDPEFIFPGWHGAWTIEFHLPYVYLSLYQHGLAIIDISDPRNPQEVKRMPLGSEIVHSYASRDGTRLYVSDHATALLILDVTEPRNATVIGQYHHPSMGWRRVASSQDGTWMVSTASPLLGTCTSYPALAIDTANEREPKLAAPIEIRGTEGPCPPRRAPFPGDMEIRGNLVFIAWMTAGLRVFEISNPYAPTEFAKWTPPAEELSGINPGPYDVFVEGDLIFVSSNMTRVHILRFDSRKVPRVAIDAAQPEEGRLDVGNEAALHAVLEWPGGASAPVTSGWAKVTGEWYPFDADGWVRFPVLEVGKMPAVERFDGLSLTQTMTDPQIIVDRVSIELEATRLHMVGEQVQIGVEATYEYDGTPLVGEVWLNDTLTKDTPGSYGYTASGIRDDLYGLTAYSSNSISLQFETPTLRLEVPSDSTIESELRVYAVATLSDGTPVRGFMVSFVLGEEEVARSVTNGDGKASAILSTSELGEHPLNAILLGVDERALAEAESPLHFGQSAGWQSELSVLTLGGLGLGTLLFLALRRRRKA